MTKKITLFFIALCCIIATETLAQNASRLIARHTIRFDNVWAPFDSANYIYSPGRGGDAWDLNSGKLPYDTAKAVAWDGANWLPYMEQRQTISTWGLILDRTDINMGTNNSKLLYTYDGNGNKLEELTLDWQNNAWVNQARVVYTYDGNNNMLTQTYESWSTTNNAWVNPWIWVYSYDGNNNMVRNVSASWNTGTSQFDSSNLYTNYYNTGNKQDSSFHFSWNGGWQLSSRTTSTYDMNWVSLTYLVEYWVNNAWEGGVRGFTVFDQNNIPCGDSTQQWITWNSAWRNFYTGANAFDGNMNSVSYLYKVWDTGYATFINNYVDSMAYNTDDLLIWSKRQGWDTTNQVWVGMYGYTENKYYYEPYTAAVKNVSKVASEMKLYPVPARSYINISVNWNKPQNFTAAIYDVQGRLLRQWGETACKEYKINMLLQGLPPGNYVLKLRGKEEHLEKRFVIAE